MPFETRISGEKTEKGRSLYISMHGGGNTPPEINHQQWRNQILLYTPEEGVYIAPRAPFNDWNMWFRPEMDFFFDRLIQLAVIELDVNPDKVYLLGYSAGGDGVYRMAPRMADRWAAAAMMAGHPGDVSPLNLRNIGFSLWVGAKDSAYDRNKKALEFQQKLLHAREVDPSGYVYEAHILENKAHWMDLEDAVALEWMAKFRRTPLPEKIAWCQEESEAMPDSFYWLSIPSSTTRHKGDTLIISHQSNTFDIEKSDYSQIIINVNDELIDFGKSVRVVYKGEELFHEKLKRSGLSIYESIRRRGDQRYIFSSRVHLNIK
ncbi:MAG: alpha/beta hydrolase [Verrucomicrobiota bacterium]|nr:alpha/beta hydrolase [Verrucomicrobiota bacterium]